MVFTKHENSEGWHCMQMWNFFDAIVIKVQEDQCWQAYQVLNLDNMIVLEIKKSKAFFTFKKRHMSKFTLIQIKPIWISISLTWLTIYNQHSWYLWQLSENDFILVLNSSHNTIL